MSKVGEMYIDVGVRGLSDAQGGLDKLRDKLKSSEGGGKSGGGGLLGSLGGLVGMVPRLAPVAGALGGVAAVATKVTAGLALIVGGAAAVAVGLGAAAMAGTAMLAELGRSEGAGEQLKAITAGYDGIKAAINQVVLEGAELIAHQTGLANILDRIKAKIKQLWEQWRPVVVAMIDLAVSVFNNLWDIAVKVFDGIIDAVTKAMDFLGISLKGSEETWSGSVKKWVDNIQFFFSTFRLRLEILWERYKIWVDNLLERFTTFVQNLITLGQWLWDNWEDVLQTIGNYANTIFKNLGHNIKTAWQGAIDWVSGNEPKFDFKNLEEGFESSIKKMPEFVKAATVETNDKLEGMRAELERRRKEFDKRVEARDRDAERVIGKMRAGKPEAGPTPQFGMVGFADLARRQQEDTLKALQERMAKATEKTAAGIAGLAEAAAGPGLKVRDAGGGARFG